MATQLAEQLRKLAVPQSSAVVHDKKRPSFLFDPKEAANFSKEIFYQIGLDGLEDLKDRNPAFSQFQNTLFSFGSKDFERSVQSEEANKRLNKQIKKFMLLLSPYFTLNCAHKCLEWLIYRYSIHEYNKDELVMLILPYHETNLFVRALQLIKISDSGDKLFWLKSLQKPGVHLTKLALFNHAASNPQFLQFVSKFVLAIIKEHSKPSNLSVAFNFFTVTLTGALDRSAQVNETQISNILPALLKGLQSDIVDFCAASYIITAKLISKTQLSEKIMEVIVNRIASVKPVNLRTEAVLLLIVVYQSQRSFKTISAEAIQCLAEGQWFTAVLQDLSNSGSYILPFLEVIVKTSLKLVEENEDDFKGFLENILNDLKLDKDAITMVINQILDSRESRCEGKTEKIAEKRNKWLSSLLQTVERHYPDIFDEHVNAVLKLSHEDGNYSSRGQTLVNMLNSSMDLQRGYGILEKLYHPQPNVRKEGIKFIVKNYRTLNERHRDQIKKYFFDRLSDENGKVLKEILAIPNAVLTEIIDEKKLRELLLGFLRKHTENKHILKKLCSTYDETNVELFLTLVSFLLQTSNSFLWPLPLILNSQYGKNCPLIITLQKTDNCKELCNSVYLQLCNIEIMFDIDTFLEGVKKIPSENLSTLQKYLVVVLLSNFPRANYTLAVSSEIIEIFHKLSLNANFKVLGEDKSFADTVLIAKQNKLPWEKFCDSLNTVISKTEFPDENLCYVDFISYNYTNLFSKLIAVCLHLQNYDLTQKCISHFCTNSINVTEFLLNFCNVPDTRALSDIQIQCLKYLLTKFKAEDLKGYSNVEKLIGPYILILCGNKDKQFRCAALDLILVLLEKDKNEDKSYNFLLKNLVKHREEFLMDHEQVPLLVYSSLVDQDVALKKLVSLASNTNLPRYINADLLYVLMHLNNLSIYEETCMLATSILKESTQLDALNSKIVYRNICRFDTTCEHLQLNSNVWSFIEICLKNDQISVTYEEGKTSCPSVLILNQINREVFEVLSVEVKKVLLDEIINIATVTQNPEVLASCSRIFKHIDLDLILIIDQLKKMCDARSSEQTTKRRKARVLPTADILDMIEWKKGVTVLEFVQNKKKMQNIVAIIPLLFEILKKCLDFDEQASVEYPKQLILSTLLHCCDKTNDEELSGNLFNVELIVQCIRASQNPQTHHHALLLLSRVASIVPTQVLHHVMAIFTFMGSSVLRQDDAYSFQIISKIIETIIPVITCENSSDVLKVLRVFVDVILDVPEHRRLPLYKQLLKTVDAEENLHLFLLLALEAHVLHANAEKQKLGQGNAQKRLDIAADLCIEFSSEIVMTSCIKILEHLIHLPVEKNEQAETDKHSIFTVTVQTHKQYRHYKYSIVQLVSTLLSCTKFVNKIAESSDEELLKLEPLYKDMIVNILTYIQNTSKVAEKNLNTPQSQFWKAMLHNSYEILDSINALLTPQMFLLVIKGLVVHSLNTIKKRALELFNLKLQNSEEFIRDCDEEELFTVVTPLINIVKTVNEEIHQENEIIVQTALLSLKLLVKQLAPGNPQRFVPVLNFITDIAKIQCNENILSSVILCLAELCANLRAHAISGLNKYLPTLLRILKTQRKEEKPSLLLLCTVTALQKIIDSLPLFLSPYLVKILCELSYFTGKFECEADNQKTAPLVLKLKSIRQKIGSAIPQRVLVPAVEQTCETLMKKGNYLCIGPLMTILGESLSNLSGPEVQACIPELTTFFLSVLQLRSDYDVSSEDVDLTEGQVINAMTILILKLSETTFRPLYYKLYDWAIRTTGNKNDRIITFYNLSSGFAEALKGLFTLFAGHFVNNAASVLDACNVVKNTELYFDIEQKNIILTESVLKTLHLVFLYDTQTFVTKDRFDVLMQPIVDQLENTLGDSEKFEYRVRTLVIPCVVQLAVATANDALWKQMNYQILLKMRHTSPTIRLLALECLTAFAKKLGDDFLSLLPETIPFLAELLEDEDETVEKACEKAVQELEKVLGEPLNKYF